MNRAWPWVRGFAIGLVVAALALLLAVWAVKVDPPQMPEPVVAGGGHPRAGDTGVRPPLGEGSPEDPTVQPDAQPEPEPEATVDEPVAAVEDTAAPADAPEEPAVSATASAEYALYAGVLVAYPVRRLDEMDLVAPAWTKDGRFLAWFQHGPRSTSVWVSEVAYPSMRTPGRVTLPAGPLDQGPARWPLRWHRDGIGLFTAGDRLYFFAPGGAVAAEMLSRTQVPEAISDPAISPDGGAMAISVAPGSVQIWERQSDRLTQVSSDRDNHGPAWSPDGTRVAWAQDGRGGSAVLYSWADTPEEHGIEVVIGAQVRPVWVDDDTLAYFARRDGRDVVRVIRSDGLVVAEFDRARPTTDSRIAVLPGEEILAFSGTAEPQSRAIMLWKDGWAHPVGVSTPHYDLRDIALVRKDGRVLAAYTAKEAPGSPHWSLWLSDITAAVDAAGPLAQR